MRFAFWRKPALPALPPQPSDDRPDPEVQLRMAQARVQVAKIVAQDALDTVSHSGARARKNHISEALGELFVTPPPPRRHHRMPRRKPS